ncbi:BTAD domain-containing putative transcriptional regulator [Kitasatospora sp. NPDC054939]
MLELRIRLLGGFRVRVGTREIADDQWRLRKARSLVKLLALTPGHRLPRARVLAALWPALAPEAAANQLRRALHEARRALDPDPHAAHRHLESGEQLALVPAGAVRVDVDEFEQAALHARRSRDPRAYERAVARYGGDLLPEDRYEAWAADRERALHAEYLALLVELGGLREARADLDGAAAVLRRAVAAEPLDEAASLALMQVHALAGRRYEAVREYDRLAGALDRDTDGTERPGPAAQRLREQVRTGGEVRAELAGELWEHVGDARTDCGDTAGAAAAYAAALRPAVVDLPASPGLPTRGGEQGAGLRAARLHRKAAAAHLADGGPAAAGPQLAAAETALAREEADPAESGRLLAVRAGWLAASGRHEEAQRAAEGGLAAAEQYGGPADRAAAREALAVVEYARGAWREALHREIEHPAGGPVGPDPIASVHACLAQHQLYADGPADSVEAYARHTLDLAIARGDRAAEAFAWCLLGESLLLRGHWDEAPGCLERSAHRYAQLPGHGAALPRQRLAEYEAARGDSAAAAEHLRRGLADAERSPVARHAFARLYATAAFDALERGEPGEAVRSVRAAARTAVRHGECPTCAAPLHPVAAEAFAALGDVDGAAEHAAAARAVPGAADSAARRAMAQSALGSLAAAHGDRAGARARHLTAARLYTGARQPYWAARAKVRAAADGGARREDRVLRAEAAEAFEALGARRALAALRGERPLATAAGPGRG